MNIASIDIGSNSVILLIAKVESSNRTFIPLLNEYRTPRISRNMSQTGIIDSGAISRLLGVLHEFKEIAVKYDCHTWLPASTYPLRKAENAEEVINFIMSETGLKIRVLSGIEEASLTFKGAVSVQKDYAGYMIDIGGGSTEVTGGRLQEITPHSFNFGAVNLTDLYSIHPPVSDEILERAAAHVGNNLSLFKKDKSFNMAISVAGTPTSLACMNLSIKEFSESMIENYQLDIKSINAIIARLKIMSPAEILSTYGSIIQGREDVILTGAVILRAILQYLGLSHTNVSTRGLRHGLIEEYIENNF